MNPIWLARNVNNSWRYSASALDAVRRLLWIYSGKLPSAVRKQHWQIGFCYPEPVGELQLFVRANAGSDSFIHGEVFEHQHYRLPLAEPPSTILDLGANAGFTAIYFGRVYPNARLACVEPVPDNLRVLERNLELNSIRAEVFRGAVDVTDGRVLMKLETMDYGHRICNVSTGAWPRALEVAAFSIPTILGQLGWKRIGLLKMDIEGHEKALFAANCEWLHCVDALCIECHDGFGEADLKSIAARYEFLRPERLPGVWLLRRKLA